MKMSGRVYKGRIRNSLKEHALATTKTTAIEKSAFEAPFGDFVASSDGLRKGLQQGVTAFAEAGALSKQNVDAVIASANAVKAGFDALSSRATAFHTQAVEINMNAAREIMASKNVQELFSRQVQYLQTSFQAAQSEFSSVSAIVSDVAKASVSPITERVTSLQKLVKPTDASR